MSRVRWRTERSEACPGRGPARITLRLLRRKKKRRSNRQPRAAARGRPPPCAPPPRRAVRGQEHGPTPGARQHTARPVKDHSSNHGAQRPARGVGARCLHAARQPTPAPRSARVCASPVPRHTQGRRPRSASTEAPSTPSCPCRQTSPRWSFCWCAQRGLPLTQEPCGITLRSHARRKESPRRARCRPNSPVHGGGRRPRLGGRPGRRGEPPQEPAGAA
jgi:hypothetical protein